MLLLFSATHAVFVFPELSSELIINIIAILPKTSFSLAWLFRTFPSFVSASEPGFIGICSLHPVREAISASL